MAVLQSILLLLMLGAYTVVGDTYVRDFHVQTFTSACMSTFFGTAPSVGTRFMSLKDFVDCARTTPMDATIGYQIAKYAVYARELHSLRQWEDASVKSRFEGLLGLFSSATSFTPAASGISELDFLYIITNAFDSAHDLHFQFKTPSLFGSSRIPPPILLNSRYNTTTSQQELYIAGFSAVVDLMYTWFTTQSTYEVMPSYQFSFTTFGNQVGRAISRKATVTKINGISAMDWASRYMRDSFPWEDDGASFNWALMENFLTPVLHAPSAVMNPALTGSTAPWAQYKVKYPSGMVVNTSNLYRDVYELDDGTVIIVPVVVDVSDNQNPDTSCVNTVPPVSQKVDSAVSYGKPAPNLIVAETQRPLLGAEDGYRRLVHDLKAPNRRQDMYVSYTEETPFTARTAIYRSNIMTVYSVPRKNTSNYVYVRINGFAVTGDYVTDATQFSNGLHAAMDTAQAVNTDTMAFDVTNNGGGFVALEELIMGVLNFSSFGSTYSVVETITSKNRHYRYAHLDKRNGKTYKADISSKIGFGAAAGAYVDPNLAASDYKLNIGSKWYDDAYNLTQVASSGNITINYATDPTLSHHGWYGASGPSGSDYLTGLFENTQFYFDSDVTFDYTGPWKGIRNITVISNGFCASACSMFTTRVGKLMPAGYSVRSVTYGGVVSNGNGVQVSQTCGGSVKKMSCPPNVIREVPATSSNYLFPGRADFAVVDGSLNNYFPMEITYNEYHWYTTRADSTPRQYQAISGDATLKLWQPNLEQRFVAVYPDTVISSSAARRFCAAVATIAVSILLLASMAA